VLDWLGGLVNKSLLVRDVLSAGEFRFRMLETIRAYGLDQLAACGESERVRAAHAAYYLQLAEDAEPHVTGAEQSAWLMRLEQEHDNLRAALEWVAARGEVERGLRCCGALWRFWLTHGHLREGRQRLACFLAAADERVAPAVRAKALGGAGALAAEQGDYQQARVLSEQSLALHRARQDRLGIALALNVLANIAAYQGDYGRATALHEESLALFRQLGDQRRVAVALNNLGLIARDQGDLARAKSLYEESLALKRSLGDRHGIALTLNNLADAALSRQEYARGAALCVESLALFEDLGDRKGIGLAQRTLAHAALLQGDHARAAALFTANLDLYEGPDERLGLIESIEGLAAVAALQGHAEHALLLFAAARAARAHLGAALPADVRARYERIQEDARRRVDDDRRGALRVAGESLTLEAAVAEALRHPGATA
jgi:tetratricopeptide (TPR) repeat protein